MQDTPSLARQESTQSDSSVRASKRRRVPNKFYGYSSDEESDKTPHLKRTKLEEVNRVSRFFFCKCTCFNDVGYFQTIPAPSPPMLVPPITIKTAPMVRTPTVEPITLKLPKTRHADKRRRVTNIYRVITRVVLNYVWIQPPIPPIRLATPRRSLPPPREDSATDSNDSEMDDDLPQQIATEPPKVPQPQLYCYCRCPYDEVSEMIG